jgi:hypothetical protein
LDPDPLFRGADPDPHQMSRIPNTDIMLPHLLTLMRYSFDSENHLKLDVKEEESESEEGIERTVMVDLSSSVVDKQER